MSDKQTTQGPNFRAEALLEHFRRQEYQPIPQRELLHQLGVPPDDRAEVRRTLRRLIDSGQVVKLSRGRLAAVAEESQIRGRLTRHRDGYGFVASDKGGEDLFVPERDLGDARTGDIVLARITRRGRDNRVSGVLEEIVERDDGRFLGLVLLEGQRAIVHPLDPSKGGEVVQVDPATRGDVGHRDVVAVELSLARRSGQTVAKVLENLGHIDEPGTDIAVVARQFELPLEIPQDVLKAAEKLPDRIRPADKRGRERFDNPAPVTIDGETAKDFDDAVAVEPLDNGGFRLYVHIADVAHFVQPGSVLDVEAQARGTSVYFPGTVLPMFPEQLSNNLCSLLPGADRLVQSAVLDLDRKGEITSVRFADGLIRSAGRLTYTQVSEVLESGASTGLAPDIVEMLQLADRLRGVLETRRARRGSIDFDLPVPRILLDVEGAMTGIAIESRNRANQLIEEFMLAANEAVAAYLEEREAPCMYRIHEPPDPLKLETLARFAETLGFELPADISKVDAEALRRLFEEAEGRPEHSLLSSLALRSMKQARYSMENQGHFGLAAPTYCHFTSPIRRYPDLVVHRLLRRRRHRDRALQVDMAEMESLAESCCELERRAESAERDLLAWKKVAFIEGQEGEEFDGLVTAVTRFGLFVQLTENLVEGLVRVDQLGADFFEFDEHRQELRGERIGKSFRLGDALRVRVERVDRLLRRVDFSLIENPAGESDRPSRPQSRPGRGARRDTKRSDRKGGKSGQSGKAGKSGQTAKKSRGSRRRKS